MTIIDSLTDRQREVYDSFAKDSQPRLRSDRARNRRSVRHQFAQRRHVPSQSLEKKGLITREPNMSRAIQLAAEPVEERGLPMAGRIAAGVLHEAIEQDERIDLGAMFSSRKNQFVLRGDGRFDDRRPDRRRRLRGRPQAAHCPRRADRGRHDRRRRSDAQALYLEKNRIRLEPANSSMKPIYVKNAQMLGRGGRRGAAGGVGG